MDLAGALVHIQARIAAACLRSGRRAEEVTLIAVSKTFPPAMIQAAHDLGLRNFGENKVQEFLEKYPVLPSDIHWHFIGRMQTNKVKDVLGRAVLIHSLDRLDLLEKIDKQARSQKISRVDCLLQVNGSGEMSKAGVSPGDAAGFLNKIPADSPVQIKGLMTMGPLTDDCQEIRRIFRETARLFNDLKKDGRFEMKHLSMGMSGDFEIAVEEGATMVRIGAGLFGGRRR